MEMKTVTCKKCGWVAFEVTRKFAEKEVKRFNCYFLHLSLKKRHEYYGNHCAEIVDYEECMVCGGSYKNFRDAKEGDCPNGCTLNPIIRRGD